VPVFDPAEDAIPPRKKGLPVPQPRAAIPHRDPGGEISDYMQELLNRAKGAIARLGYLQAISAENINNGEYMWQVEIPVKHRNAIEMVSMSVEKEHRGCPDEDNESWIIRLAVDLPQLGPVQVRISKFKQGVSTCFWSDSARVRSLIEGQFERLKSNLEQHGLRNLHHSCLAGSPTPPISADTDVSSMDVLA
jgi:flagellar hook-length control protein FliK